MTRTRAERRAFAKQTKQRIQQRYPWAERWWQWHEMNPEPRWPKPERTHERNTAFRAEFESH